MKMAVFSIENAFCVGLLQSFYDEGDLDENAFCVGLLLRCDLDDNSCFPLRQT